MAGRAFRDTGAHLLSIAGWALEGFFMGVQLSGTVIDGRASRDTVGVQLLGIAVGPRGILGVQLTGIAGRA